MINYNPDGSIRLPESLAKIHKSSKSVKVKYDNLFEKAKNKQIKVLFLIEKIAISKNIYSDVNKEFENPLIKIFEIFNIKTDDMDIALEKLLEQGCFIIYLEKNLDENNVILKNALIDLDPKKIVAIGNQFDNGLGFIRDEGRFIDEKIELDDELSKKIKTIINGIVEEKKD